MYILTATKPNAPSYTLEYDFYYLALTCAINLQNVGYDILITEKKKGE